MSQIVTDLEAPYKHKSRINQKNFGRARFRRPIANRSRVGLRRRRAVSAPVPQSRQDRDHSWRGPV